MSREQAKARQFATATVDIPHAGVYKLALQCANGGSIATIEAFTNAGEPRPIAWPTAAEPGIHIRRTDDDSASNGDALAPTGLSHVGRLKVFPNETVEFSFSIMSTPGDLAPVEKTKRQVFQEMCFSVRQPKPVPAATPVRVTGNIKPPTKTKDVRPVYPRHARMARLKGVVVLDVTEAAIDAVAQWECAPTLLNGAAVPVVMTVPVSFAF
jgi:hypothetical protein